LPTALLASADLAVGGAAPIVSDTFLWSIVCLALALPFILMIRSRRSPNVAPTLELLAVLTPCFLAPLSVLHVWALVPGNLGIGMGGFAFFLDWLTRYPNLGPVNLHIFLGIGCVLGTAAMPVGFGLYALFSTKKSGRILALWATLCLIPFVPVLVMLDVYLWLVGLTEPTTIAGPVSDPTILYGPLLRTLPLVSMSILAMKRRDSKK
jgi:hypothetical protein